MAGRKRSLLEKFISGLARATTDDERPARPGTRVVPAGTYRPDRPRPMAEMTGAGMAARAGRQLGGRGAQLREQERGIIGR